MTRKTVADFMQLPEGARAELIEGEITLSPSPKARHQRIVSRLDRRLRELFVAPFDVHLPSGDVVEPDLVFVATRNRDTVGDWIHGVPEYWIVDPEEGAVDALTLKAGVYELHGRFGASEMLTSPTLADRTLPVTPLLA